MKKDFINVIATFSTVLVMAASGSVVYNKELITQIRPSSKVLENNSEQNGNSVQDQARLILDAQIKVDAIAQSAKNAQLAQDAKDAQIKAEQAKIKNAQTAADKQQAINDAAAAATARQQAADAAALAQQKADVAAARQAAQRLAAQQATDAATAQAAAQNSRQSRAS